MSSETWEYIFGLDYQKLLNEMMLKMNLHFVGTKFDGRTLTLEIQADLTPNQIATLESIVQQQLPLFKLISKRKLRDFQSSTIE